MATTDKKINEEDRDKLNYRDKLLQQDGDVVFVITTNNPKTKNPNAHSVIIEMRCKKMAEDLKNIKAKDGKKKELPVDKNINGAAVCEVLRFIYTDKVHLKRNNVFGVKKMAKKYEMINLVEACKKYITEEIAVDTVCDFLDQSMLFEDTESKQSCLNFIGSNAEKVLTGDKFVGASKEVVATISKLDYLEGIQEIVLFNACVKWAKQHEKADPNLKGKALYEKLDDILPNIRFPVMEPEDFSKDVYETKIFEGKEKEYIELCTYISRPQNNKPEVTFQYRKEPRMSAKPEGHVKVIEKTESKEGKKGNKDKASIKEVPDYLKEYGMTDSVWKMPI